jgi:hypothetical protein
VRATIENARRRNDMPGIVRAALANIARRIWKLTYEDFATHSH